MPLLPYETTQTLLPGGTTTKLSSCFWFQKLHD